MRRMQAGEYQTGLEFLVWSVEYLLKTIITGGSAKPATWAVVWQVCHTFSLCRPCAAATRRIGP